MYVKKAAAKRIEFDKILQAVRVPSATLIVGVLLIISAAFGYNIYLGTQVNRYAKELEGKRVILNDLKKLAERRSIIEKISREEARVRETISNLGITIPNGIALSKLTYTNSSRTINIKGEALSTALVGKFLKNLEDSPYFSSITLHETRKQAKGEGKVTFAMTFKVN